MPQYISTTKKYMRDPALRCRPAMPGDDKKIAAKRRAYEKSIVELPSTWSWKTLPGMTSSYTVRTGMSKSSVLADSTYFPFCEELYNFATGETRCDWEHCIGEDSKSSTNTYNFPCGCTNPDIQIVSLTIANIKPSSAFMQNPDHTRCVEIPRCPVFAQGAVVKKRKRKKSKLSLTDNRYYSRKVRERSQKAAKTAKGCSKQLLDEDEPTDSE